MMSSVNLGCSSLPKPDTSADSSAVKKRVTDRLMPLDYVSGVGGGDNSLKIYLVRNLEPAEHQKVRGILDTEAPGKAVEFVTTGEFKAQ